MSGISYDAWKKALDDLDRAPLPASDAITIVEFADLLKVGRWTAARKMQRLVREGKATQTKKLVRASDGRVCQTHAYVLVKESDHAGRADGGADTRRGRSDRSGARARRRTAAH